MRSSPSTDASITGGYKENATVHIICAVSGATVSDWMGKTNIWYKVSEGYISAAIVGLNVDASFVSSC
ncbi:MAG: hypothetical protein KF742_02530 [Cryobacterium sp.]|nr:hypothetical protein [Cryobacterium sp.]